MDYPLSWITRVFGKGWGCTVGMAPTVLFFGDGRSVLVNRPPLPPKPKKLIFGGRPTEKFWPILAVLRQILTDFRSFFVSFH